MKPVVFLDIDGVLNGHEFNDAAQSTTIKQPCVAAFNYVLSNAKPEIVISSAWRYSVLCGSMTTLGFEILLRTHGVCGIVGKIIGTTRADEHCAHCNSKSKRLHPCPATGHHLCRKCGKVSDRAHQVRSYLCRNPWIERYVVIDDEDYGFTDLKMDFVRTKASVGLTMSNARKVVKILTK